MPVPLEMDCGVLQADKDTDIPDEGIQDGRASSQVFPSILFLHQHLDGSDLSVEVHLSDHDKQVHHSDGRLPTAYL